MSRRLVAFLLVVIAVSQVPSFGHSIKFVPDFSPSKPIPFDVIQDGKRLGYGFFQSEIRLVNMPGTFVPPLNLGCQSGTKIIFLTATGSNSYTVDACWNSSSNIIRAIGGGSGGGRKGTALTPRGAGAGGAYSDKSNQTLTPNATITYNVGVGGTGATVQNTDGTIGGDTWFCNNTTSCTNLTDTNVLVSAQGGQVAGTTSGGVGGAAANGVGTNKFSGGNGGADVVSGTFDSPGGGGAAGAGGNGGAGGAAVVSTPTATTGSAGGGGCGNATGAGSAGTTAVNQTQPGQNGGNNGSGSGGGAGGVTAGSPGASGGGGGGGGANTNGSAGGAGGASATYTASAGGTAGCGGGGGGGAVDPSSQTTGGVGGAGGLYGGGGGTGGAGTSAPGNGGNGAPGIIILSFSN